MNARKEERRPPPPLLQRAGFSSHWAPKRRTQRSVGQWDRTKSAGYVIRGPALCLSVALLASDNKKFLHGHMEGAITHNEGPVRLVVWGYCPCGRGNRVSPLATEGTPKLVAIAVWIITNVYLTTLQQKYKPTVPHNVVRVPRKMYSNVSFTKQVYS